MASALSSHQSALSLSFIPGLNVVFVAVAFVVVVVIVIDVGGTVKCSLDVGACEIVYRDVATTIFTGKQSGGRMQDVKSVARYIQAVQDASTILDSCNRGL